MTYRQTPEQADLDYHFLQAEQYSRHRFPIDRPPHDIEERGDGRLDVVEVKTGTAVFTSLHTEHKIDISGWIRAVSDIEQLYYGVD